MSWSAARNGVCRFMANAVGGFSTRIGVGGRGGQSDGDFLTDMSIGSVMVVGNTALFGTLAPFILVLCLAVSFALSSAATVDLAGNVLMAS